MVTVNRGTNLLRLRGGTNLTGPTSHATTSHVV